MISGGTLSPGLSILVMLLIVCVGAVLWWLLLDWVYSKVKPSIERWLWRRVGGEGDPPADREKEDLCG